MNAGSDDNRPCWIEPLEDDPRTFSLKWRQPDGVRVVCNGQIYDPKAPGNRSVDLTKTWEEQEMSCQRAKFNLFVENTECFQFYRYYPSSKPLEPETHSNTKSIPGLGKFTLEDKTDRTRVVVDIWKDRDADTQKPRIHSHVDTLTNRPPVRLHKDTNFTKQFDRSAVTDIAWVKLEPIDDLSFALIQLWNSYRLDFSLEAASRNLRWLFRAVFECSGT